MRPTEPRIATGAIDQPTLLVGEDEGWERTGLVISPAAGGPDGARATVSWTGAVPAGAAGELSAHELAELAPTTELLNSALLPEHWTSPFELPGLRGFRQSVSTPSSPSSPSTPSSPSSPSTPSSPSSPSTPSSPSSPRPVGTGWSPRFADQDCRRTAEGGRPSIHIAAEDSGLELLTEIETVAGGAVRARHTVTNRTGSPYVVEALEVVFPIPDRAREVLDFTTEFGAERVPQRHVVTDGLWSRQSRTGRPSHDSAWLLTVGTPGFGFDHGEVWSVHVAWSGNSSYRLQRTPTGGLTLGGGELFLPGELILTEGESYQSPWVYLVASGHGLDPVAQSLHGFLRAGAAHPARPRPVSFNGWEAIGFHIDEARLRRLADLAASVGAERYVLDDGWFGGRRDDTAGLGDWTVARDVFPDGLSPLIEHVHQLGMQFGIWFEPEMVNPDSALYRAHPEWVLATGDRLPVQHRNQWVLDLTQPRAFAHVLGQLDQILTEYPIDYVKWDQNRPLVDAGSGRLDGAAAVHEQTLAFYRLIDELRARHPGVEWEICAGGGGRIDLEGLARFERIWPSDNTDAISRQWIQRWTQQLVPPEYLGTHVSREVSPHTGRTISLDFRAATALFGSFGIEWALDEASESELAALARWVDVYKAHRELLHTGDVIRIDPGDPSPWIHGVVAHDGSQAILCVVGLPTTGTIFPRTTQIRPRGLDPSRPYRVVKIDPAAPGGEGPVLFNRLSGRSLLAVGIPVSWIKPAEALLLRIDVIEDGPQ